MHRSEQPDEVAAVLTRRELLRRLGLGSVALAATPSLLAACSSSPSDTDGATASASGAILDEEIDTFRWAFSGTPNSLDTTNGWDTASFPVITIGVESLLTYDDDKILQPMLAESWEQPDLKTYVFAIREGVTFWDGSPLTAEDVVASIERHLDPSSQQNYLFANVDTAEATGPMEVTVTLKRPDVYFRYVVAAFGVLPKRFLEQHGKEVGSPQVRTMGTGPFEIADYVVDESITYQRRDDYWGEPPAVRELQVSFVEEGNTRVVALQNGSIDGAELLADDAEQAEAAGGVNVLEVPGLVNWFYVFRLDVEPFGDVHVRRAMAHALDREGLAQSVYRGHSTPAVTLTPPAQWPGDMATPEEVQELYAQIPTYDFDLDKARTELAQSSVPNGFATSIHVPSSYPAYVNVALSWKQGLSEIGIDLDVQEVSDGDWFEDWFGEARPNDVIAASYGPDYPDPANFLDINLRSDGAYNYSTYSNPEVDRLMEEQARTTDLEARKVAILEVMKIAATDLPEFPLFWENNIVGMAEGFTFQGLTALRNFVCLGQKLKATA